MEIKKSGLVFPWEFEKRTSTVYIIVHHAKWSRCTMNEVHQDHISKGWNGFGYNFWIPKIGEVIEARPIWAVDADAYGHNYDSISICFEGDFDQEQMTPEQIEAGIWLIRHIKKLYPGIKALRHRDVSKTSCPGENFKNYILMEGMRDLPEVTPPPEEFAEYFRDINVLVEEGHIKSPEYWKSNAVPGRTCRGDYVMQLIKNVANGIKGGA